MNLNKRDQRQILEYLKHITDELTDAYNTAPDTPEVISLLRIKTIFSGLVLTT